MVSYSVSKSGTLNTVNSLTVHLSISYSNAGGKKVQKSALQKCAWGPEMFLSKCLYVPSAPFWNNFMH